MMAGFQRMLKPAERLKNDKPRSKAGGVHQWLRIQYLAITMQKVVTGITATSRADLRILLMFGLQN
jgi:hypothetical protein